MTYLLYKKKHAVEKNREKLFLLSTLSTGGEKVIEQTRLMDGEGDAIMRIGRKGQERRKVMEKGQGKRTDTLPTDDIFTRKEYIEREAAIKAIESVPDGNWRSIRYAKEVKAIPAADVVARDCYDRLLAENDELRKERPVVRCKDCTHSRKGKASLECEKHAYAWDKRQRWVDDNDFCCWGVRKDGDE